LYFVVVPLQQDAVPLAPVIDDEVELYPEHVAAWQPVPAEFVS
jgi:hypothetical protein